MSFTRAAAVVVAVLAALVAGAAFGRWRTERAVVAAVARAQAARKTRDPNAPKRVREVKDGQVVGHWLVDPVTGTRTALPLDAPDPREPQTTTVKED